MFENSDSAFDITLVCFDRVITHVVPIILSMYVFWHNRQQNKSDYLKFCTGTFSLSSYEYLEKSGLSFKSTLGGNVN